MKRYAIVKNARDRKELEAYLPDNYKVVYEYIGARYFEDDGRPLDAGWTLDGYVIPRLGSGLIWAKEIDLSHPIMKQIPA